MKYKLNLYIYICLIIITFVGCPFVKKHDLKNINKKFINHNVLYFKEGEEAESNINFQNFRYSANPKIDAYTYIDINNINDVNFVINLTCKSQCIIEIPTIESLEVEIQKGSMVDKNTFRYPITKINRYILSEKVGDNYVIKFSAKIANHRVYCFPDYKNKEWTSFEIKGL